MATKAESHRREEWLIVSVFALGAIAFTLSFFLPLTDDWFGLAAIVILSAVSERLSVKLYFDSRVSMSFVGTVLAALLFGPAGAVLAASAEMLSAYTISKWRPRKLLFNVGETQLAAFAAAAAIEGLRATGHFESSGFLIAGGGIAGFIVFTVGSSLVSTIVSMNSGRSVAATYRDNFAWLLPHHVVLGMVAGALAIAYGYMGLASILVLALPLLMSRYSMQQFVDRTRDNVLRLEKSNDQLKHAYLEIREMSNELREAYTGTLESLVTALDVRDQETRGHSVRVATHSVDIAKMLGIKDDQDLACVYRGALMHDVGKIGVPDAILLKPAKLTDEEWEFMRRHPAMGYRILAQVPYLRPAARIVLAHHERWDGDGYPRRLKGENIPLGARIFALCDTYDAIISDRPYRKGQSPDAAFAEILRCANTQFDPQVIEAFEAAFPGWREEKVGNEPLYLPTWYARRDEREEAAS
jgi:hypothetical protein